jgi:hypothetical protein
VFESSIESGLTEPPTRERSGPTETNVAPVRDAYADTSSIVPQIIGPPGPDSSRRRWPGRLRHEVGGSYRWDGDILRFRPTGTTGQVAVRQEIRIELSFLLTRPQAPGGWGLIAP